MPDFPQSAPQQLAFLPLAGRLDAAGFALANVGDPVDDGDAVSKRWALANLGGGSGGVTDHGALSGLGDDDHPLYALADGSRGAFAAAGHDHDDTYAPASHTHPATDITGLATVATTGSYADLSDTPLPAGLVRGDLLYHDGTSLQRLPAGADGEVVKLVSGLPTYQADAVGSGD